MHFWSFNCTFLNGGGLILFLRICFLFKWYFIKKNKFSEIIKFYMNNEFLKIKNKFFIKNDYNMYEY